MPSIFISYRRSDSHADAGRIYDRLVDHFGKASVFKDVDDIPPGVDFRDYLSRTLNQCSVLLAVIGPTWLTAADRRGQRRLDNPADWVRVEIEEALRQEGVLVVPLLVSHASMPRVDELPSSLQDLAYRNCREARPDPDFHRDMGRLIEGLDQYFEAQGTPGAVRSLPKLSSLGTRFPGSLPLTMTRQQFLRWAGGGCIGALGALGLHQLWQRRPQSGWNAAGGWPSDGGFGWYTPDSTPETSDLSGDYLAELLEAKRWQDADLETSRLIVSAAHPSTPGWPTNVSDLSDFSCRTLRRIDELWVAASGNKFGFSVQRKIYQDCGGSPEGSYDQTIFECFLDKVGWRRVWESSASIWGDSQVTYDLSAPAGHLPWLAICGYQYCDGSLDELRLHESLFARVAACATEV